MKRLSERPNADLIGRHRASSRLESGARQGPPSLPYWACRLRSATVLFYATLITAHSADRFPQPQFENQHIIPSTVHPLPRGTMLAYLDVAVLVAALVLATVLAHKRRSRRGMFGLMLGCLLYFGFWRHGCVCPVGSLQNIILAVTDSSYAVPLPILAFFMLPLVSSLLFGRVFCAAVCPLGGIQDVAALRPVQVPTWIEHALSMLPVVYLGGAFLFVATGTGFLICRLDPFVSFFRLNGPVTQVLLGVAFLGIGVLIARPYCRFVCPYGVLLNWTSRLARWHVTITPDECVHCRLCETSCPFNAIKTPTTETGAEPRSSGLRRLAILLLLVPALMLCGAALGVRLSRTLATANATVRLAEQMRSKAAGQIQTASLETDAFESSGTSIEDLFEQEAGVLREFRTASGLVGVFLGLAFGLKLVGLSVKRRRDDYEPDRGRCLSCARCFSYCPKDHAKRSQRD